MQAKAEKSRRDKGVGDMSDDGEESEEEDPMEYLDLVKSALFETRRILEDIDEHGGLYLQIWEIFNIFCGKLINIDDDDSESQSDRSTKTALQKSQAQAVGVGARACRFGVPRATPLRAARLIPGRMLRRGASFRLLHKFQMFQIFPIFSILQIFQTFQLL